MEQVVRATGLTKTFHAGSRRRPSPSAATRAVDGLSLTIEAGQRVALLGPNGAGKTTTLFMLLGVISPDGGHVEIDGLRLPEHRSEAMLRVGFAAGYMPLAERLRVREFLDLYGGLYGVEDPRERIDAGLDRFGIAHLANVMGNELSSGQRTLVGIIKATLHAPRLLVLDEPTASLDPDVAQRVRQGLRDLCDTEGTTLLVTSHNMVEVTRLCGRVIFMSAGRIVADGSPSEVAGRFGRDDLEDVFLHLAGNARDEARTQETDHA